MKPPSRQLYVENHRAHEVMLGSQQSVQGNSGIIMAVVADHFGKWFGHLAKLICTENAQEPAVIFRSASSPAMRAEIHVTITHAIAAHKIYAQTHCLKQRVKGLISESLGGNLASTPGPLTFVFSWRAWFSTTRIEVEPT